MKAKTRQRSALTVDEKIFTPQKEVPPYGSVCLNCQTGNHWVRVVSPETEEEHEESKRKGKSLVDVIAPGVKTDASGKRRDGDKRELSDRFQTITFEPITVDVIGSQAQPANVVFVTVNVGLHSISVDLTALKAKLDKGAQGNIYTDCH